MFLESDSRSLFSSLPHCITPNIQQSENRWNFSLYWILIRHNETSLRVLIIGFAGLFINFNKLWHMGKLNTAEIACLQVKDGCCHHETHIRHHTGRVWDTSFGTRPRPIPRSSSTVSDTCFVVPTTSTACKQAISAVFNPLTHKPPPIIDE